MALKVEVENLDPVRRRLAVEVPAEIVTAELNQAFLQLARSARVPGFRQGRAPRHVLERAFGHSVRADVYNRLIQSSLAQAADESHVHALGAPEIVTENVDPGAALRFSAIIEVLPEFSVSFEGLAAERTVADVAESDVDALVERMRQSLAQLHPIEDRSEARPGDVVNIDYEARIVGRIVSKAEGRDVEIGSNPFPPEFDANLVGAQVGSEIGFFVNYGEEASPEVAGKTVEFRVVLHRLSRKELPLLDDDFAKDQGEFATVAELRQRVRQQLEADAATSADEAMRRSLLDALASANDIPIPSVLVRRRAESLVEEVRDEWRRQRLLPKNDAVAMDRLYADLEPRAREQVKVGLLLDAVARQEKVTLADDELVSHIDRMVAEAGAAGDRVRALYQDDRVRRQLHARLVRGRTIDLIASRAVIREVPARPRVADAVENG